MPMPIKTDIKTIKGVIYLLNKFNLFKNSANISKANKNKTRKGKNSLLSFSSREYKKYSAPKQINPIIKIIPIKRIIFFIINAPL